MKKIAYFSTQFTTVKSGPGRFVEYLTILSSTKLSFVFITDDALPAKENPAIIVCPTYSLFNRLPGYWILRSYLFYSTFSKWLKKGNAVDAIVCSSALEAIFLLSFKKDIPVYVLINDYKYLKSLERFKENFSFHKIGKAFSRVLLYPVEKQIAIRASYVVANSLYTQSVVHQIYKIPVEKILLLYKAVDLDYFKHQTNRSLSLHRFLFIKNDWRIGGLDLIIKAFSQLSWQKEITLTIAGIATSEKKEIEKIIRLNNFKGAIKIHPVLPKKDLLPLYYSNDVFISMPRQESFGISILEAMATGLPIISSDEGGIPEVLDHGHAGCIVQRNNIKELVDTLNGIKRDPHILRAKNKRAQSYLPTFSLERLIINLEKLFA